MILPNVDHKLGMNALYINHPIHALISEARKSPFIVNICNAMKYILLASDRNYVVVETSFM